MGSRQAQIRRDTMDANCDVSEVNDTGEASLQSLINAHHTLTPWSTTIPKTLLTQQLVTTPTHVRTTGNGDTSNESLLKFMESIIGNVQL